jgi:hypothetical protein
MGWVTPRAGDGWGVRGAAVGSSRVERGVEIWVPVLHRAARVTIARRLAAAVLAMWKNGEDYEPTKHERETYVDTGARYPRFAPELASKRSAHAAMQISRESIH